MTIHTLIDALRELLIVIPAVLLTITVHEYSQGFVAVKSGDSTPLDTGLLRLNPLLFIDSIGFILFVLFRYGWSKSITFDYRNFKHPHLQAIYVILSGTFANLVTAFIFILLIILYKPSPDGYIYNLFMISIQLNLNYFLLNLLPIYPLDGGKIINLFLPQYYKTEFIGVLILILAIIFNVTKILDKLVFTFINIFI